MTLEELQAWLQSQIEAVDAMSRKEQSLRRSQEQDTARMYYVRVLEKSREVVCSHLRALLGASLDDRADIEHYPFCPDCGKPMPEFTEPAPTTITNEERYLFLREIDAPALAAITYRFPDACKMNSYNVDDAVDAAIRQYRGPRVKTEVGVD